MAEKTNIGKKEITEIKSNENLAEAKENGNENKKEDNEKDELKKKEVKEKITVEEKKKESEKEKKGDNIKEEKLEDKAEEKKDVKEEKKEKKDEDNKKSEVKEEDKGKAEDKKKDEVKEEDKGKAEDKKKDEAKGKKTEAKIVKKEDAFARGVNLHMSKKQATYICSFINGKTIDGSIYELEQVIRLKKAVPFKGEIPHRKGKGIMSGRYPVRASKLFIYLLKSLKGNVIVNGLELDKTKIYIASASWASRPMKSGRRRAKRTNVLIKAKEFEEKK